MRFSRRLVKFVYENHISIVCINCDPLTKLPLYVFVVVNNFQEPLQDLQGKYKLKATRTELVQDVKRKSIVLDQ